MRQECKEVEKGPQLSAGLSLRGGRGDKGRSCEIGLEVGRWSGTRGQLLPVFPPVSPASPCPVPVAELGGDRG